MPVPDTAKDIQPIHAWPTSSALGSHRPRPAPPGAAGHLVLLVRGALLARYPSTLVYAQRAEKTATSYALANEQQQPVFAGRLRSDIALFGFALTAAEDSHGSRNQSSLAVPLEECGLDGGPRHQPGGELVDDRFASTAAGVSV